MFIVTTTVEVKPGSIDELAALFDSTNRELVAPHFVGPPTIKVNEVLVQM